MSRASLWSRHRRNNVQKSPGCIWFVNLEHLHLEKEISQFPCFNNLPLSQLCILGSKHIVCLCDLRLVWPLKPWSLLKVPAEVVCGVIPCSCLFMPDYPSVVGPPAGLSRGCYLCVSHQQACNFPSLRNKFHLISFHHVKWRCDTLFIYFFIWFVFLLLHLVIMQQLTASRLMSSGY